MAVTKMYCMEYQETMLWSGTVFRFPVKYPFESTVDFILIDYLGANLREKPFSIPRKTQTDQLQTSMKTAKKRERIVKLLKKMQEANHESEYYYNIWWDTSAHPRGIP